MPRYFFDTDDGERHMQDDEGYEFPGCQEACDAAIRFLPDVVRDLPLNGLGRDVITTVRDASKQPVVKVTLSLRTEWLISSSDLATSQQLSPPVMSDGGAGVRRLSE